jgi:hypothetical protein
MQSLVYAYQSGNSVVSPVLAASSRCVRDSEKYRVCVTVTEPLDTTLVECDVRCSAVVAGICRGCVQGSRPGC